MISKKERTRETILSVTYELFAREGFNKITMKDICEATGMSRGGLYSHFGSTREVFEAIFEKMNQKDEMNFEKEMEAGMSAVDILDRALTLMRDEMEHAKDSLSLAMYEYACTCSDDRMNHFHEVGEQKWSDSINMYRKIVVAMGIIGYNIQKICNSPAAGEEQTVIGQTGTKVPENNVAEGLEKDEIRYCTNCGKKITAGSLFCPECGKKVQ